MAAAADGRIPLRRRSTSFINNSPHFFKVVSAPASQGVKIPINFMCMYGDSVKSSTEVVLKVPAGTSWRVQLRHTDSETWLGQGWEEFASYYGVKLCDFLVFRYVGDSQFDVTMFNERATQIQYLTSADSDDDVAEISRPGASKKRQKNMFTLASSSSEPSEEDDVEIYEPIREKRESGKTQKSKVKLEDDIFETAIYKQRKKNKMALSSSESSEEIYEPVFKKRESGKMQKNKVKLEDDIFEPAIRMQRKNSKMAMSSSESSEEEDVEIYEPVFKKRESSKTQKNKVKLEDDIFETAIRKQRKKSKMALSSSESSEEEDVEIYEPIHKKRESSKMQKNKSKLEEDEDIFEPPEPAIHKRRKANKAQKSLSSSEEEDVETYEPIRKNSSSSKIHKNKVQKSSSSSEEEDVEIYEPVGKKSSSSKIHRNKVKMEEDVDISEPRKQQGKANKVQKKKMAKTEEARFGKKKEYLSYKRAKAFKLKSENPSFIVFMQPSYVTKRFKLSFSLAFDYAENMFPKTEAKCKLQIRVPRSNKVWELGCNLYWRIEAANVSMGWKQFVQENKLGVGDVCVFESVKGNLLDFNITIFRESDES